MGFGFCPVFELKVVDMKLDEIDGWIEDKENVSNYIDYVRLSFLKSAS